MICEEGGWASLWARLSDGSRYWLILTTIGNQFREIGGGLGAVLGIAAALLNVRGSRGMLPEAALPVVFVTLAGTAYVGIYVVTPHDLSWHLSTSLDRLLLQLHPATLFGLFVVLQSPEEVLMRGREARNSGRGLDRQTA